MTDLDRQLGLRHHFRSAAASCEGRANAASWKRDEDLYNALADVFYEQAEQDDHDTQISRHLLAVADILNDLSDDKPRHRPLTDESCGVIPTTRGRQLVDDYRAHRTRQHPKGHADV